MLFAVWFSREGDHSAGRSFLIRCLCPVLYNRPSYFATSPLKSSDTYTGTVFLELIGSNLAGAWVGLCHVIRGQVGRFFPSIPPEPIMHKMYALTTLWAALDEVSTVWLMAITVAVLQLGDPGLNPCDGEHVSYSKACQHLKGKFSYQYCKCETTASRRLTYLSIKTGNRRKQRTWLCPKVTKSAFQHL